MQDGKSHVGAPLLKWAVFLLLLTAVMGWAIRGVLGRAGRMKTADTSASAFANMAPGTQAKAVVRLDQVADESLKGTLLERQSDTIYLYPAEKTLTLVAILTPETSVVMGKPQDIVAGAIVQLAGTVDNNHVLRTKQVVILTGYVRLSEGTGDKP